MWEVYPIWVPFQKWATSSASRMSSTYLRIPSAVSTFRRLCSKVTSRILLIEDEPGLVLTLTDRLNREGYEVRSVSDGETGQQQALACSFDLIVLDVML